MADELSALIVAVEKKAHQRVQATVLNLARLILVGIITGAVVAAGVAAGVTLLVGGFVR